MNLHECMCVFVPVCSFILYSQLSAEDLDRVPANSTSNILNRLLVTYDSRIRPNFKGADTHPLKHYLIHFI